MKPTVLLFVVFVVSSLSVLALGSQTAQASAITRTPSPTYTYRPLITPVTRYVFNLSNSTPTAQPYTELDHGRIIYVVKTKTCEDTMVYGAPGTEFTPLYGLPKGSEVTTREIYKGWVMIKSAKWIPLSALCQ